jgi:ribosomal protein S19E (S16A)
MLSRKCDNRRSGPRNARVTRTVPAAPGSGEPAENPTTITHIDSVNKKVYTKSYNGVAITEKQYNVMMYVIEYRAKHGIGPAVRDFMRKFGLSGPNAIRCHLNALKSRGLIEWSEGKSRTIRPAGSMAVDVPADLVDDVRDFIKIKLGERP